MVVWHNTELQCGKNGRGLLRAVYCLLGPKILVTPLLVYWCLVYLIVVITTTTVPDADIVIGKLMKYGNTVWYFSYMHVHISLKVRKILRGDLRMHAQLKIFAPQGRKKCKSVHFWVYQVTVIILWALHTIVCQYRAWFELSCLAD